MVMSGFWGDTFVKGTVKEKIHALYKGDPSICRNDRILILYYWVEYEHIREVLRERFQDFAMWFLTGGGEYSENIRRQRQKLTEDGIIPDPDRGDLTRGQAEAVYRQYWGE